MPQLVELVREGLKHPSEARRYIIERTWRLWERFGFFVCPDHYYYPIPRTAELRRKQPWNEVYPTDGIDFREDDQLRLLDRFERYRSEYDPSESGFESCGDGPVLYGMVRTFEPERIIEVGSGASTRVALEAAERNRAESSRETEVVAVEPYPDEELRDLERTHDNLTLRESKAEDLGVDYYTSLERGDFLFVDSSHVMRVGNDVNHLYLKVLPQLPEGVFVHSHDIWFPREYPRSWLLEDHHFWTEQYLLQSFMAYNEAFDVVWAGGYMAEEYSERLDEVLTNYDPDSDRPGSFWIRRTS